VVNFVTLQNGPLEIRVADRHSNPHERIAKMKIALASVSIDDYDKAVKFYTEVLGFILKRDIPLGSGARWITVVSPEDPDGTELLLEPNADYPAMKALKEALMKDGIAFTAFRVENVQNEYERLKKLEVEFTMEPTNFGMSTAAILNDTCGNLIQIYQANAG
jgi:catechol 2,3-dioxygenase-like lactoylglutathione lyase family enzyme